jgi:hypothetical protein
MMSEENTPNLKHKYGRIDLDYATFLATRQPEEDGPIYMVNLMKYHEVAQYSSSDAPQVSGREADDKYNPASILNKIGADIVFVADVTMNHIGDEDWDRIAIVRYATRKSFIDMQQRKDFADKHEHKAAGMKRTTIVCCRPVDEALDTRSRPDGFGLRNIVMIVRQTPDREQALSSLPQAVGMRAEGTIIGDGRKFDTVQFVSVANQDEADALVASVNNLSAGESYAMTVSASIDGITA